MMRWYLVFLVCIFPVWCLAQYQTDSLLVLAEQAKGALQYKEAIQHYTLLAYQAEKRGDHKTLGRAYKGISEIYEFGEVYEKALEYLERAHQISPDKDITLHRADLFAKAEKYKEALSLYHKMLKQEKGTTDDSRYKQLSLLRKAVVINQKLGEYTICLEYNSQILAIQLALQDAEGILIAKNNIGYTYKQMKNYNQAIRYFQEALSLEKKNGLKPSTTTRINLGVCYQNIDDYPTAIAYLHEARRLIERDGKKREMAKMYALLSTTYLNKKDFYNARYYNDLAKRLAEEIHDMEALQRVYETSSLLYQADEKFDKALDEYKKHLAIRDSLALAEHLKQADLHQQQMLIERTERELQMLVADDRVREAVIEKLKAEDDRKAKEIDLQRSLILQNSERLRREESENIAAKQALDLLRRQAEVDKHSKALTLLRQLAALRDAELMKKSAQERERTAQLQTQKKNTELFQLALKHQEEEAKRKDAEAKQSRYLVWGTAAISLLVILFVGIGLLITRNKNRQLADKQRIIQETNAELTQTNEEIAAQRDLAELLHKEIAEKSEHILASILYAQQIQQAILVTPEAIAAHLPEYFILFEPRDIVSGDFYFFAQVGERSIFAAVDCTGHGVPGAFMSMIGHEILEDITLMRGIVSPDTILDELHKGIRKALKQRQTNNRDGMDLALVSIDKQAKMLEFAGAKNPLVYVQGGQIYHIKGDKMPIGGEQTESVRHFTKHTVALDSPTMLYMLSDGYPDQFGGEAKKKFTIGRMKDMFLAIHALPAHEQKETLANTLHEWIAAGKEYQIDDILVVGVRL